MGQNFETIVSLIEDLNTGINKVDFLTIIGWKVFNSDILNKDQRKMLKHILFSYGILEVSKIMEDYEVEGVHLSDVHEEFKKQFPNLIKHLKNN